MFKKAFTLAEMMIVILIIGVVSALTIPTLTQNTTEAQIGPKLAKAVASLEQANMMIKENQQVDRLTDIEGWSIPNYIDALSNQLKVVNSEGSTITLKDNMRYEFVSDQVGAQGQSAHGYNTNSTLPHRIPILEVVIDINGGATPNVDATDRFHFTLMADGSLIPYGKAGYQGNSTPAADTWNNATMHNCINDAVPGDATLCAGSIFSNNLKVMYK